MKFTPLELEGLMLIEPVCWEDSRGFFLETYHREVFQANGIAVEFVQDNLSMSRKGVLRGLHAQGGVQAQGKLVRVIHGRVYDVAVDVRVGSPTFGQHYALELSADNQRSFWIPPGFLHGFLALEDDTVFMYKVTGFYDRSGEFGVRWDDPDLGIRWPIDFDTGELIISEKDRALPLLRDIQSPF